MEDKSASNVIGGKSMVGRVMAFPPLQDAHGLVVGTSEYGTGCSQEVFAEVIDEEHRCRDGEIFLDFLDGPQVIT